ncbi:MAG: hypothetical protein AAGB16_04275 [Pseudomonadota bacterium]
MKDYSQAGKSMFMGSVNALGNVLAFIAAFLATPPAYSSTIYWVQTYTARHYGYGYEDITAVIWGCICAALIFFLSRATIATALTMGGLALATRLF